MPLVHFVCFSLCRPSCILRAWAFVAFTHFVCLSLCGRLCALCAWAFFAYLCYLCAWAFVALYALCVLEPSLLLGLCGPLRTLCAWAFLAFRFFVFLVCPVCACSFCFWCSCCFCFWLLLLLLLLLLPNSLRRNSFIWGFGDAWGMLQGYVGLLLECWHLNMRICDLRCSDIRKPLLKIPNKSILCLLFKYLQAYVADIILQGGMMYMYISVSLNAM